MIRNILYSPSNSSLTDQVQFTNDLFDDSQENYSGKDRELIETILSRMPAYTGNMIQRHIAGVFSKNSKFSHVSFGFNYLLNKPCTEDSCNTTGVRQSSVHAEEAAIRQWLKNFRLSHLLRRVKYGKWCFLPSKRDIQPT